MAFYHPLKNYENDPDYADKQAWIATRLLTLRHDLCESIKKDRQPNSLIIGSWNIRAFDDGVPRMDESYQDDEVMKALKDSKLTVPDFGPTNLTGTRWFDQMAFTADGKADKKTRLLRHGKFDWRHAVFGPHPENSPPPLLAEDIAMGKTRLMAQEFLDHYEPIVEKTRANHGKAPYLNWGKAYKNWTTYEMSDHLPIWMELEVDYMELEVDYSDDYLRRFL